MRLFPLGVVILCNMVSRSHIDQTALLLKKANFALQFHSAFNNKAMTYEQKLDQIPLIKEKIDGLSKQELFKCFSDFFATHINTFQLDDSIDKDCVNILTVQEENLLHQAIKEDKLGRIGHLLRTGETFWAQNLDGESPIGLIYDYFNNDSTKNSINDDKEKIFFSILRQLADEGNEEALFTLGMLHVNRVTDKKSHSNAERYIGKYVDKYYIKENFFTFIYNFSFNMFFIFIGHLLANLHRAQNSTKLSNKNTSSNGVKKDSLIKKHNEIVDIINKHITFFGQGFYEQHQDSFDCFKNELFEYKSAIVKLSDFISVETAEKTLNALDCIKDKFLASDVVNRGKRVIHIKKEQERAKEKQSKTLIEAKQKSNRFERNSLVLQSEPIKDNDGSEQKKIVESAVEKLMESEGKIVALITYFESKLKQEQDNLMSYNDWKNNSNQLSQSERIGGLRKHNDSVKENINIIELKLACLKADNNKDPLTKLQLLQRYSRDEY